MYALISLLLTARIIVLAASIVKLGCYSYCMRYSILIVAVLLACAAMLSPASAAKGCSIPASWGTLRGATYNPLTYADYMHLEAADGTIRTVHAQSCKETLTITRTP